MDLDLRQLRVFEALLRERNLTRASAGLGVSQPALSKTLAGLRAYFDDPLFIRVGHRMEPTAKALSLEPPIKPSIGPSIRPRPRGRSASASSTPA